MLTLSSHHTHSITIEAVKSTLKGLTFISRKERAAQHKAEYLASLRAKRDRLDAEALNLIGNNDAYYANRMESWTLTEKILKEVQHV